MRAIVGAFSAAAPFIVGIVCGALLLYSVSLLLPDVELAIGWLGAIAVAGVLLAMLVYLVGRIALARPSNSLVSRLYVITESIEKNPDVLNDKEFLKQNVWPLVPVFAKLMIGWFAIGGALALALALVTNVVLMATLAVQYLQAERLDQQNRLIVVQSDAARISQERELIKDIQQVALVSHEISRFVPRDPHISTPPIRCQKDDLVCGNMLRMWQHLANGGSTKKVGFHIVSNLAGRNAEYVNDTAHLRRNVNDANRSTEIADLVIRPAAVACAYGADETYALVRLASALRALEIAASRVLEIRERSIKSPSDRVTEESVTETERLRDAFFGLLFELGSLPRADYDPFLINEFRVHLGKASEAQNFRFRSLREACRRRASDLDRMLAVIRGPADVGKPTAAGKRKGP